MPRICAIVLALVALTADAALAQSPSNAGCPDGKASAAANAQATSEGTAAGTSGKGSDAGVAKDGPGTTGWSSGTSEAGIQKDGKAPTADGSQPETAKGLDPTKGPC